MLTDDEADSLVSPCGLCWASPGCSCQTPAGRKRSPHKVRIKRADRRGALNGVGRAVLEGRKLWAGKR